MPEIEMHTSAGWQDWPISSWDDSNCNCDQLDNHTFCSVHGCGPSGTGEQQTPEHYYLRLLQKNYGTS